MLAVRMSKRIRQEGWTSTPIYVGIVDAVPNKGQNEIESNNSATCINPLDSDKYLRWAPFMIITAVMLPRISSIRLPVQG